MKVSVSVGVKLSIPEHRKRVRLTAYSMFLIGRMPGLRIVLASAKSIVFSLSIINI